MIEAIAFTAVSAAMLGLLLLLTGLVGRETDPDARRCRRCGFDVLGLVLNHCPECGLDLLFPQATVVGRRRKNKWAITIGVLLILPAVGGIVTRKVFEVRGISTLQFVSEERLLDQFLVASQESRRYDEFREIERRHGAGELSTEAVVTFAEAVLARGAGMQFMSSIHPNSGELDLAMAMVLAPTFPTELRQKLFEGWLEGQASRRGARWSIAWGEVLVRAHARGLLTTNQFERFVHNGLEVEIFIDEKEPIQPGQRVWVAMRWKVRLGDDWGSMSRITGVASIPGLDEWCNAPRVSVYNGSPTRIGRITVPSAPGDYEVAGTVGVSLAGGLDQLVRMIPKQKPDLTTVDGLDWVARVSCSYTVVPEAPNHEVDAAE